MGLLGRGTPLPSCCCCCCCCCVSFRRAANCSMSCFFEARSSLTPRRMMCWAYYRYTKVCIRFQAQKGSNLFDQVVVEEINFQFSGVG